MNTHTPEQIKAIIDAHGLWLDGEGGERARLDGARLFDAMHVWAQVAFAAHGECGRMLTAYRIAADSPTTYQCGCFDGSRDDLVAYIEGGDEHMRSSRLRALAIVDETIGINRV